MSPKLLHQSFASDHRIEMLFEDASCPLYIATLHDERLLDTGLLPENAELFAVMCEWHRRMLNEKLQELDQSIENLYDFGEEVREEYFTLRVKLRLESEEKVFLEFHFGEKYVDHLLPVVLRMPESSVQEAKDSLLLWHYDNDLRNTHPLLWLQQ